MSAQKRIQPLFQLDNKVAIVTGASKGIGEAMARGLAEFGAKVVISSRKRESVDAVAESFQNDGLEAIAIAANMGNVEEAQTLIDQTVDAYGGIDIIINNAAANPVFGPIQNTEERAFDKILDVNLKGPFELCKKAYPILKQRGGGSIINISSIGGLTPERGIGIYSVSKAGLINLTKVMAQDWGADNIRVNAICPGLIKTKFSEALWGNEPILDRFLQQIPLNRVGTSDDVAGLAVYLASDAAAYCTGGVYLIDGGYTAT
ncbi:MAG TPA: glucose 1-dehydrogenase [Gammaproteobacteria bacterium]|jgi:NAD(P)-dependent dehydrogenase (short-subunit alcohol dehydrogenase family)|nr:glucose 1-dehydrogenase [Gammaproteobacteria bacterium]|tara:strand:- start:542 stop:1324 length:783 start_codon:yes stop_codon:yes gene_type:complete